MQSNTLYALVLGIIIVGGILFFIRDNEGSVARTATMAELPISYSAVTHLASELGYFAEEGVMLEVTSVPAGPDVVASLRSPSGAELGTIAITPIVSLIAAGETPLVLATTITSNEQVQLVTFENTGITEDPTTLRGKRIGRVRNTVGEIYLTRLLEKGELTATDVVLVDGRPADLMNLLVQGDIDAAALWDPFVAQAKRSYETQRATNAVPDRGTPLVFVDRGLYTLAYNVVTTEGKRETARPAIEALLRALVKTEAYIRENPAEAQSRLETWLSLQSGDLDHFMQTTDFTLTLDVPQVKTWLAEELAWLGTVQEVKESPSDFARFIDASFLRAVDAERVEE